MYHHPALADGAPGAKLAPGARARGQQSPFVRTRVHALRPGTWPADPHDITITAADIAAIAAAYDPARYQAPVVIGHPETDDPAWGWVLSAEARADGLWLEAELLPEMAQLVREGRYRAVSVSLWMPDAPGNPTPGTWALKHLGYLGAAAPAVKGLALSRIDASARSEERTVRVEQPHATLAEIKHELRALVRALEGDDMTRTQDAGTQDQTRQAQAQSPALAERESRLAERESKLAEREAQIARRERELRRAAFAQELEAHIAAGRLLPAERELVVALMERLDGAEAISLAEGQTQPALDALRAFLARLPSRVALGERAGAQNALKIPMPRLPQGYRLSEHGLALHVRALEHMAQHPNTDYITAVRAVERTMQ